MAAGSGINHPKSVYGRKQQLKQVKQGKNKKMSNRKLKRTVKRNVDTLTTKHILKKTRTNPNANITLSGKKRRLLLKQLKREEMEKQKMDVVVVKNLEIESKSKKLKNINVENMDISQHDEQSA